MDWNQVAADFERDGATRDIYVLDATTDDWNRVVEALRKRRPPPAFFVDGEPAALPARVEDIMAIRPDASPFMRIDLEGLSLNCHFFDDEEIEFDLDPTDIDGPERLTALVGFMTVLADATGKPALLTHENLREAVIVGCPPPCLRP
jgi:hypothetical protein